jgi:hypothetical protein
VESGVRGLVKGIQRDEFMIIPVWKVKATYWMHRLTSCCQRCSSRIPLDRKTRTIDPGSCALYRRSSLLGLGDAQIPAHFESNRKRRKPAHSSLCHFAVGQNSQFHKTVIFRIERYETQPECSLRQH